MRKRTVARGFVESIVVANHSSKPIDLEMRIRGRRRLRRSLRGQGRAAAEEGQELPPGRGRSPGARLQARGRTCARRGSSRPMRRIDEGGLTYRVRLEPHGEWSTQLEVRVVSSSEAVRRGATDRLATREERQTRVEHALAEAPQVRTDWLDLLQTYRAQHRRPRGAPVLPAARARLAARRRAAVVHGGLRTRQHHHQPAGAAVRAGARGDHAARARGAAGDAHRRVPRRGAGKDSPRVAHRRDDRVRRTAAFAVLRHRRRDAAVPRPARRVRAVDGRRRPRPPARAACARGAALDRRRTATGCGTATSRTSGATRRPVSRTSAGRTRGTRSLFRDGSLSKLPRACCEIQGYAYDAKMRCARLARTFWNDAGARGAARGEARGDLKERFNRDFWMPERECFALAIDGDGRQVDSITSNIGHLLWSGIVDDDKAPHVVQHLMGDALFSGWGVRTMAEGEGGYNPIGYHVGTVWPHDNSIIALGLNRYGYRDESARIASGILQAARYFKHRLPEAFAGYARAAHAVPGRVPDRVQPAGVGDRSAAAVHSHDARARAARQPADRRCVTAARKSSGSRSAASADAGASSMLSVAGQQCPRITKRRAPLRNPRAAPKSRSLPTRSLGRARSLPATGGDKTCSPRPQRWHRACTNAHDLEGETVRTINNLTGQSTIQRSSAAAALTLAGIVDERVPGRADQGRATASAGARREHRASRRARRH